jgi:transcriptional regulator with XRE-family HTH domain
MKRTTAPTDPERFPLAHKLRTLREARHLTTEQLADLTGYSVSFLNGLELPNKGASQTTLDALAKALRVPKSELRSLDRRQRLIALQEAQATTAKLLEREMGMAS